MCTQIDTLQITTILADTDRIQILTSLFEQIRILCHGYALRINFIFLNFISWLVSTLETGTNCKVISYRPVTKTSQSVVSDVISNGIQSNAGGHALRVKKCHRDYVKQNLLDLWCNCTIIEPWIRTAVNKIWTDRIRIVFNGCGYLKMVSAHLWYLSTFHCAAVFNSIKNITDRSQCANHYTPPSPTYGRIITIQQFCR